MFATPRVSYAQLQRQYGVFQYGVNIIPDENGMQGYKLCVQKKRHYRVVFKPGDKVKKLVPGHTACDGSCEGYAGKILENCDPQFLYAVGIYSKLPADQVLAIESHRRQGGGWAYRVLPGGSIVNPEDLGRGTVLKDGEQAKYLRTLERPINLTPATDRGSRFVRPTIVTTVEDVVKNVNGQALIETPESQMRQQEAEIDRQAEEAWQKAEAERKKERSEFAEEIRQWLRGPECGFSNSQIGQLFQTAGPGQCRDAVERARAIVRAKAEAEKPDYLDPRNDWDNLDIMEYAYRPSPRKDWQRIRAVANYIVGIGGVPADNKK